ncbi:MAG TPA: MBL fold metallo-hydrolase [Verrucomicrobiae bacterium]|nr:MBL fold metallo-hydrolase [Verrucomicrobiae bacterium]
MTSHPSSALVHEILPVGILQCNCHIVGDPATREAIVIDPGDEVDRILAIIVKHRLMVKAIISTHAHIDHVGGLKRLHDVTGAPVLMNEADIPMYQQMFLQAQFLGIAPPPIGNIDDLLREDQPIRWGNFEMRVLHTPGHSPGSVSLYLAFPANAQSAQRTSASDESPKSEPHVDSRSNEIADDAPRLFAGDTLFAGSIGRTDLWGGSYPEIIRSIRLKLLSLPENTVVFPGHGPATTLAAERASNPFLQSS